MKVRTEIDCHNCGGFFWWDYEDDINGNFKIICPKCGHDHYRVVRNGVVTDERWDRSPSQNTQTVFISSAAYHTTAYETYGSTGSSYFQTAWMNYSSASTCSASWTA